MRRIISTLTRYFKGPLRRAREVVRTLPYYGKGRFCPVCEKSSRRFRPFGLIPREDARCVHCGSLERHRLLWLYLSQKTDLFCSTPKKVLHVAPASCIESKLKKRIEGDYVTADLSNPCAMVKMDITDIQYPDESFDVILCSHVLEHVHDDKKAMREFHRVLKRNGLAILLVPIDTEETFEDPSIIDPQERLKTFGKENHVRRYGPDYIDRLLAAGFRVKIIKVNDFIHNHEAIRMGLTPASGQIYCCTK